MFVPAFFHRLVFFLALCMWISCGRPALAQSSSLPTDTLAGLLLGTLDFPVGTDGPNYARPAQAWLSENGKPSPEDTTRTVRVAIRTSQPTPPDTVATIQPVDPDPLPDAATAMLETLNVRDADVRDVFRGIAHQYGLNLVVHNGIDKRITVRLSDIPVIEALEFLCRRNGLQLKRTRNIFYVEPPPQAPPPPPTPPRVFVRDSLLTVDLNDDDLETVMRMVAQQSASNIMVRRGIRGQLSGMLKEVPVEQGLQTLLQNNGFALRNREGILHVDREHTDADAEGHPSRSLWVQVEDSLITLDVANARVADVVREITAQTKVNLITYDTPEERITAKASALTFDEALNLLLRQTSVTFRKEDGVYFIGNKQTRGIVSTRLLRLKHIRADAVLELIPAVVQDNATIQVVKEQNGLMVTSTHDIIFELETFLREVDHPTPQILIEALVIDFKADDLFELGINYGRDADEAAAEAARGYRFNGDLSSFGDEPLDDGTSVEPGFFTSANGPQVSSFLNGFTDLMGFRNVGRLPDDFFLKIRALSVEGKANVRSRPQLATLNGHTASLTIGTTQYYILRSQTPYQSPSQVLLQQSQRFEKIEANVTLEITPWVSASGEITADIRPEFSTPVGDFDPDVPPTINSRVIESTVRLRDGETIILGGLIQDETRELHNKVPILGSIPLLGRLFRSTSNETTKSELVIFLTPHVFYGDDRDNERWNQVRDSMELQSIEDRNPVEQLIDRVR